MDGSGRDWSETIENRDGPGLAQSPACFKIGATGETPGSHRGVVGVARWTAADV
jgi:hypothetical protein